MKTHNQRTMRYDFKYCRNLLNDALLLSYGLVQGKVEYTSAGNQRLLKVVEVLCNKNFHKIVLKRGYHPSRSTIPHFKKRKTDYNVVSMVFRRDYFSLFGSTCQKAYSQCRWQQTCGWHLSEIEISCASNRKGYCDRASCSQALRRFSTYVDRDLQEAMTFCTCKRYDVECMKVQKILFPTCMYSSEDGVLKSCNELVKACKESSMCRLILILNEKT
uniref:GDNF/GAS1 domain-containing protein n=1 Tax=Romanomermis culicivorax TaxID=13658 RepID=A0A915K5V8_ROMCU